MKREPFFGSNAKPFLIQMAFVVFCIIFLVPFLTGLYRPYVTAIVDAACDATGLCISEAAEQLNASSRQQ